MIGPARLTCRSGVARAGASRSGALLAVANEIADKIIDGGVDSTGHWAESPTDVVSIRNPPSRTTGEGPSTGWVIQ